MCGRRSMLATSPLPSTLPAHAINQPARPHLHGNPVDSCSPCPLPGQLVMSEPASSGPLRPPSGPVLPPRTPSGPVLPPLTPSLPLLPPPTLPPPAPYGPTCLHLPPPAPSCPPHFMSPSAPPPPPAPHLPMSRCPSRVLTRKAWRHGSTTSGSASTSSGDSSPRQRIITTSTCCGATRHTRHYWDVGTRHKQLRHIPTDK